MNAVRLIQELTAACRGSVFRSLDLASTVEGAAETISQDQGARLRHPASLHRLLEVHEPSSPPLRARAPVGAGTAGSTPGAASLAAALPRILARYLPRIAQNSARRHAAHPLGNGNAPYLENSPNSARSLGALAGVAANPQTHRRKSRVEGNLTDRAVRNPPRSAPVGAALGSRQIHGHASTSALDFPGRESEHLNSLTTRCFTEWPYHG